MRKGTQLQKQKTSFKKKVVFVRNSFLSLIPNQLYNPQAFFFFCWVGNEIQKSTFLTSSTLNDKKLYSEQTKTERQIQSKELAY